MFAQGTHCLMRYNNITYDIDLLVHNLVLNALVKPGLEFIKVGKREIALEFSELYVPVKWEQDLHESRYYQE